jgi:alpha-glucosidase (family GH31 glycosyl hydrolase)
LIPFADIEIDYGYRMFVDRKKAYRVNRKLYPRCKRRVELWDKTKAKLSAVFKPVLVRECGEALLTTLSYMELRQEWVNSQQGKMKTDE